LEFQIYTSPPLFMVQVLVTIVVFQVCFYYNELYDLSMDYQRGEQFIRLMQALGAGCVLTALLYFMLPDLRVGRGVFFIGLACSAAALSGSRVALDLAWRKTAPPNNVLILGAGQLALEVSRELSRRPDLNVRIAGLVLPGPGQEFAAAEFPHRVLGGAAELERIVAGEKVSKVVVAMEEHRGALPIASLVNIRVSGVPVEDATSTLAALHGRVPLDRVRPSWFVFSDGFHRSHLNAALKRVIDLALATAGLMLSSPLMVLTALAVRLDSEGPILFRQTRVGLGERPFEVLKFRSMRVTAESGGAQWAAKNDPRVTRVGRYLRKFRLDELPQFINVIRGDMSFVGPRPERPVFVEQLKKQIPYYAERHSVRPGLTGWAQVQYPYGATVEDAFRKLEYDLFYLKNMSVLFDVAIVIQTVRTVLFGTGAR
ncbi:MAG TPA: TIGR03013 family XrtA/PEP-CTERM system glycosyltransferase, partial [Bryobacteraceae bacterium]|nr:TIGR03013 family XrtA/PEP-CTERM system glycosyltransferase [Bryobacteraceae bacterium]